MNSNPRLRYPYFASALGALARASFFFVRVGMASAIALPAHAQSWEEMENRSEGKAARVESAPRAADVSRLNVDALLADPTDGDEGLAYLAERRVSFVRNFDDPDLRAEAPRELAEAGYFFSAVELAWFAEKLTEDEAASNEIQEQMRAWNDSSIRLEAAVDHARQMRLADRFQDALNVLDKAVKENPFSENAHYELARTMHMLFEMDQARTNDLPSIEIRIPIFRSAYKHYLTAIRLDPLHYDAIYHLSRLRDIFPDNEEFIKKTQSLTERAYNFQAHLVPALEAIEGGGRDPELFEDLGYGFETVGNATYAIISYKVAIARGSTNALTAEALARLLEDQIPN